MTISEIRARKSRGGLSLRFPLKGQLSCLDFGVGNGNRTRNRRSHSPVLYQLSYSHRRLFIIATGIPACQRAFNSLLGTRLSLLATRALPASHAHVFKT